MTYPGLPMWNESSKIHYFMDFYGFWALFLLEARRPWMLLSTKSKGHKSNFFIPWMYKSCFYDLKVHFWWPNKCSKHQVFCSNTLYSQWHHSFQILTGLLSCNWLKLESSAEGWNFILPADSRTSVLQEELRWSRLKTKREVVQQKSGCELTISTSTR